MCHFIIACKHVAPAQTPVQHATCQHSAACTDYFSPHLWLCTAGLNTWMLCSG
jgi:hypothetical protein